MKFGVLLESNDPETAWNGVRFGVASLKKKHQVKIFFMSKGVECLNIVHEKYNVKEMIESFQQAGGELLACGTCIKARNAATYDVCPISTMDDCVDMIEWADRIVTF